MKRIICLIALLSAITTSAQDTLFPMRQGAVLEYRYTDAKGKFLSDEWRNERFTRLTVEKMWGDTLANVLIENETLARTKDPLPDPIIEAARWGDVMVRKDDVLFDNVLWSHVPSQYYGKRDAELNVTISSAMSLPRTMKEGDVLPDLVHRSEIVETSKSEEQNMLAAGRGNDLRNMLELQGDYEAIAQLNKNVGVTYSMTAARRHVVGRERVTTPAGEFDCWKIEYELLGPSHRRQGTPVGIAVYKEADGSSRIELQFDDGGDKQLVPYADYLSPSVGLVRRDRLSATGRKVEESMVLTSIRN